VIETRRQLTRVVIPAVTRTNSIGVVVLFIPSLCPTRDTCARAREVTLNQVNYDSELLSVGFFFLSLSLSLSVLRLSAESAYENIASRRERCNLRQRDKDASYNALAFEIITGIIRRADKDSGECDRHAGNTRKRNMVGRDKRCAKKRALWRDKEK